MADDRGFSYSEMHVRMNDNLRSTAKWIVGGVIAAFAGIATGASLSNLGALGPRDFEFYLAFGGLVLAFGSLSLLVRRALEVLVNEVVSHQMLRTDERPIYRQVRDAIDAKKLDWPHKFRDPSTKYTSFQEFFGEYPLPATEYEGRQWAKACLPDAGEGAATSTAGGKTRNRVAVLESRVDALESRNRDDPWIELRDANDFADVVMSIAVFEYARLEFTAMTRILWVTLALASLGIVAFAWAANRPSPPSGYYETKVTDGDTVTTRRVDRPSPE